MAPEVAQPSDQVEFRPPALTELEAELSGGSTDHLAPVIPLRPGLEVSVVAEPEASDAAPVSSKEYSIKYFDDHVAEAQRRYDALEKKFEEVGADPNAKPGAVKELDNIVENALASLNLWKLRAESTRNQGQTVAKAREESEKPAA